MPIRAFVAIEMPPAVQQGLRDVIGELQPKFAELLVRWIPIESIHLTLKFIGDIPEEKVKPISDALLSNTQGSSSFDLTLDGIGVFPNAHKPSVLWVGLEAADHLMELQRLIDAALNPLGYPPEARTFSPHLTLARVHRGANYSQLRRIGELATQAKVSSGATGLVESLTLFRSELKPSGAVYNALFRSPLTKKP